MYINFSLSSHLFPGDIEKLTAIKQKETEWLIKHLTEDDFKRFDKLSYLTEVKQSKKGDHPYKRVRLSNKGSQLVSNLSFEGVIDAETQTLADWVIKVYNSRKGSFIKNKLELARRCHWFKTVTNIKGNRLALLIQCAIIDTYDSDSGESFKDFKDKNPRAILSNMGENLFWTASSIMDKHKTLDKSPLYNYYIDNQSYVEDVWRKNNLEDE